MLLLVRSLLQSNEPPRHCAYNLAIPIADDGGHLTNVMRCNMFEILRKAWQQEDGQDIAEYAVMLAVILVIVVATIRLVGSNANTVFSNAASAIQ
jgi:Flp pilus assembly pilin Flp